jgi:hypothetical protein
MSRHAVALHHVPKVRLLGAGMVATAGLALTGTGVLAGLNAEASNPHAESVTGGTLKLVMTDNGAGFRSAVSGLAPGDTVQRYVDLANTGTLDGKALSLRAADATPTLLTGDPTKGLHVTVTECSGAWSATTGECAGSSTRVLGDTPVSTLLAAPAALSSGDVTAGATRHLKVALTLPDQDETTVNGMPPTTTVQGKTAALTWTFTMTQRDGTTTGA